MDQRNQTLADALVSWNQGNQQSAIDLVRPLADESDPAALLLICWFFQQLGDRWREALTYVRRAAELGNPWVLGWYFTQMADDQETRADAIALIKLNPMSGISSNDPLGRALQFASEGDVNAAAEMLRAAAAPYPSPPPELEKLRGRLAEFDQVLAEVREKRNSAIAKIEETSGAVEVARESFGTRQKTLTELLDNLTNASSQSHFDKQATKYEQESRLLWGLGVCVLALAALAAFLPVILNYVSKSHALRGQSNVSAHLGATLALAAVAGVLLARARSRDRDRQRNRDLSVALGTMFAYSEQIANKEDREHFKHDMGRLVLETFLRQKAPEEDASRSVVAEIADSATRSRGPDAL